MNFKVLFYNLGNILKVEAALMVLPLIVSFIYNENTFYAFLIPIGILLAIGILLTIKKPEDKTFFAKEGFILVGLAWIFISLFGCLPFIISGQIPSFIDAFFETVSGFTTTGASIINDVESLSHSMLFWRSFTHWIGGMGVLVFILAIIPSSDGQNIFILKAESPGPKVGKLVSKLKNTARILYIIYLIMTCLEVIFLLFGGMSFFEALLNSFATAGTGGFACVNMDYSLDAAIIPFYSTYCQMVIAVFMLLFGINFNMYFFLLIGKFKEVICSEELRTYLLIILIATFTIAFELFFKTKQAFNLALRDSFFQVTSIITTTGFATVDYGNWPYSAQAILFILMFIGGCAGSTAGGLKISRVIILFKAFLREIDRLIHPNKIKNITLEKEKVDENTISGVISYFGLIILFIAIGFFLVSFDDFDSMTSLSAVVTCINNVGPGLSAITPKGNFSSFSILSKVVLIFEMLLGRLELYPLIMTFSPKAWLNK